MADGPGPRWQRWLLVAVLLLAFALRLHRLGMQSLWYDETVSMHLAGKSLPALVAHTAGDIHPPGYYLLLHGWSRLAGSSDFSVAYLSLAFGVLLVAMAHWLAARLFGPRVGLMAALLVAISPYQVWYSQEVRMYTLGAVLAVGLLAAVLGLLRVRPGRRPPWALLAAYALCGALGLWVLYYFAFLLVAANLLVGAWWLANRRREGVGRGWLGWWALAQGLTVLLYAPWLPVAWRQATQPPVPPWRGFTALGEVLVETWSALSLGQSVEPRAAWPVLVLVAALFAVGLLRRTRPGRTGGVAGGSWLLAGTVFLPVLLVYLASFLTPLYHVRYAFLYSTPFYVLLAAGLEALWQHWRPALWLSLGAIVLASGLSLYAYHSDPGYASDDHRAAVRFLADRWRPGDAILVNAGYTYTALLTYWDGDPIAWRGRLVGDAPGDWGGVVLVQTGTVNGDPSLGWGSPDSDFYAMSRAETVEALGRLFAAFDRVWVYRCYDTVTDPGGTIRGWLDEHGVPFEDRVFSGESQLRVQGYLAGRDPLAGADQVHDAPLAGGSLRLLGSTVASPAVPVGGALDLALVWQVASPPAGDTILFAGLFDAEGGRWAQTDERVLGSRYPAADWPVGATIRTPLRVPLPPGTPPGRYRLEVGWYRFVDGQPVWLPWIDGERLALGEVDATAPEDWRALPLPPVAHPAGVTVGPGVRLLGFDAPSLKGRPGEALDLDLFWQALQDGPEAGRIVLQLADDAGQVWTEGASAPATGRAPFGAWAAGQALRDPQALALPGDLAPGVYTLSVGRQRPDGTWLPVRRGPFPLGSTYPLATVRVAGRPLDLTPPSPQHPVEARFGRNIRFLGYELQPASLASPIPGSRIEVVLYWQALEPTATPHRIFLHLVGDGDPSDIRAQADAYPHLPTSGWLPGEYVSDRIALDLPAGLDPGEYRLLLGLYEEATGTRLPVLDAGGEAAGDSLVLARVPVGQ
jgi:hypothetical protein